MQPTQETALSTLAPKSLAHLHATVVVEELRRCGVRSFVYPQGRVRSHSS